MNDFLDQLYFYCLQKEPPPRDARYQADRDALTQMEEGLEAAVGQEFWEQYMRAAFNCGERDEKNAFRAGLRFGVNLMRSVQRGCRGRYHPPAVYRPVPVLRRRQIAAPTVLPDTAPAPR